MNDGESPVCRPCPAGFACTINSLTPCPAGQYSPEGVAACSTASSDEWVESAYVSSASTCPSGTTAAPVIDTTLPASGCIPCPSGKKCATPDVAPVDCGANQYSLGNATACTDCPEAHYCPSKTQPPVPLARLSSTAATSVKGQYAGVLNDVSLCPAGSACPTLFKSDMYACSALGTGYYSLDGWTYCQKCPIGYSCTASAATACPLGQISDHGSSACVDCPHGKACYTRDSRGEVDCPDGFYSPAGTSNCLACPTGYKCVDNGSIITLTACSVGQISGLGHMSCYDCPVGHECPYTDATVIIQCSPGTYSAGGQ
jgi:hypothetical protein